MTLHITTLSIIGLNALTEHYVLINETIIFVMLIVVMLNILVLSVTAPAFTVSVSGLET
jgi:hypothetical protein